MSKSLSLKKKTVKEPGTKAQKSITSFFNNKNESQHSTSSSPVNMIAETSDCRHFKEEMISSTIKRDGNINVNDLPPRIKTHKTDRKRKLSSTTTSHSKKHTNSNESDIMSSSLNIMNQSVSVLSPFKKQKPNTKSPRKTSQKGAENMLNSALQPNSAKCKLGIIEKLSAVVVSIALDPQNISPTKSIKKCERTPEMKNTSEPTKLVKSTSSSSSSELERNKSGELLKKCSTNLDGVNKENEKVEPLKQWCGDFDDDWDGILTETIENNSILHKDHENEILQKPLHSPNEFSGSNIRQNNDKTPQKYTSPEPVLRRSPRNHKLSRSPLAVDGKKVTNEMKSPKRSLNFDKNLLSEKNTGEDFGNMFEEDWDDDFPTEFVEETELQNLNLLIWQRCEIVDRERNPKTFNITLKVKEIEGTSWATCRLEGIWRDSILSVGDIVCMLCIKDDHDTFMINNSGGLLVQWPDTLLSGTTIAGSVFCKRKVVLQERFKGIDCNNKIMTIGSLVHELLQIALRKRLSTIAEVTSAAQNLLQDLNCLYMLYGSDMSNEEATIEIAKFLPQIVTFIDKYMTGGNNNSSGKYTDNKKKSDEWVGEIHSILDIEENIWSPRLGLKGKIDVTVQVLVHSKNKESKIMPLELKTGKASMSAEHRGQVLLYTMMMNLKEHARRQDSAAEHVTQGLLLYLKDTVTVKEISSGHPEKRDLMMLRNQLAYYLARKPTVNYPGELATSRASSTMTDSGIVPDDNPKTSQDLVPMELPEPIHHHSACGNCPYLTLCSVYLERYSPGTISDSHPLTKLKIQALGHLEQTHVEYFMHWTGLLMLENMEKPSQTPLQDIWLRKPEDREKRGKCLSRMVVSCKVAECDKRYIHTFRKKKQNSGVMQDIRQSSLQAGEYLVVSTDVDIAIATGTVSSIEKSEIRISLDRILLKRNVIDMEYHLDLYESQSMMSFNLTNLGVMMEDLDHSNKLRKIIIDKNQPKFCEKMPRSVATLGKRILSRLNEVQQRAVLKALTADHYLLIKGMPGTGKTQTVAALIELLVAMEQSVLVTSHTHSAVDNVLLRLPDTVKVMRLGSSNRVHPGLLMVTEECLTAHCTTPDDLTREYNSVKVVGVTCLGAGHPMLTKRKFDVCLVDESTQVLQSSVLRPLFAAKKFVLIGDPDQLPPIVRSNTARRLGLDESLFARLDGLGGSVSLTLQYRMNDVITRLANRLTYAGQLQCADAAVQNARLQMSNYQAIEAEYRRENNWILDCLSPSIQNSVILLDTGNTFELCQNNIEKQKGQSLNHKNGRSADDNNRRDCTNMMETAVVLALVEALLNAGVESQNIGVIAPYRDQVEQLQKCVGNLTQAKHNVEVNTVDQYQGRDKEVIIYSCTKTWNHQKGEFIVKETEILEDQRRLTVAITRAKHKLMIIGDAATLQHYSTFAKLLECLRHEEKDAFVSLAENKCTLSRLFEHYKSYFNN